MSEIRTGMEHTDFQQRLLKIFNGENFDEAYAAVNLKVKSLKDKYPDNFHDHCKYHELIGGTPPPECTQDDFPGEDSIEIFIGKLEKRFSHG